MTNNIVNISDSAQQFIDAINNVKPNLLSLDDYAETVITKCNSSLGVGVTLNDSATSVVSKINSYSNEEIKFLHFSDTHNSPDSINYAKGLLNDYHFVICTGDYSAQSGGYSNVDAPMKALGQKFLCLNGNHDVYNTFSSNQSSATSYLKSLVTDANVVWGDTLGIASYWYRDYALLNGKLRIIGVDQYDYRENVGVGSRYDTIYTQEQVNWFIERICELDENDYLIIASHEPFVNATIAEGYSYNVEGKMDDSAVEKRRSNTFCSSRLWVWDTSLTNGELIPLIIDAYQNKKNINETVNNTDSHTKDVLSSVSILKDFTKVKPANFLFYLCGHLHGEMCDYHPTYSEQLILDIDNANPSTLGNSSDIRTRSNGILINAITLDFSLKQIIINRIGLSQTESYNGYEGINRQSITFPFKRTII